MGTTLTGTTPQDTYDSLIKVTDNGPLTGSLKKLTDGLGNDSSLSLSTTAASLSGTLAVTGNAAFDTNVLFVDAAANRVGVGTASPAYKLDANAGFSDGSNDYVATFHSSTGSSGDAFVGIGSFRSDGFGNGRNAYINAVAPSGGSGSLGLQIGGGNVGIGTSAPLERLVVSGGGLQVTGALSSLDRASSSVVDFFSGSSRIFSIGANASTHGNITFVTSTTTTNLERATITSDGYLRLTANSGGIQFNGDTAAANALDDYEEGTWTMGVSFGNAAVGVTYGSNGGAYTKIGRKVTVTGFLTLTSKGSSTGFASITGLPFALPSNLTFLSAPSFWFNNISFVNQFEGFCNQGTTKIELYQITTLGAASTLTDANFSNNSEIMLSATYFV